MLFIFYIYALVDPLTKEIMYVGCTIDPWQRFIGHYSEQPKPAKPTKHNRPGLAKWKWLMEHFDAGRLVEFKVLESGRWSPEQAQERERFHLNKHTPPFNRVLGSSYGISSHSNRRAIVYALTDPATFYERIVR
ncbi:MAG: GIY-YIG nuclease family protein [Planctomycetota bacterium]|nr:GIY-YIG nuclease family protein [Planctomycetota bacterium]